MTSDLTADRIDEDALDTLASHGGFTRLEVTEVLFDLQLQYASQRLAAKDPAQAPPPPSSTTYEEAAQQIAALHARTQAATLYPTPGTSQANAIDVITVSTVSRLAEQLRDPSNVPLFENQLRRVFSSPKSLARSFLKEGFTGALTLQDSGLDYKALRSFYGLVLSLPPRVRGTLSSAIGELLGKPLLFHEPEQVRVLLIILENPLLLRLQENKEVVGRLCSRMATLPAWQAQFLVNWLSGYSQTPHIFWALVNLINSFLAMLIDDKPSHRGLIHNDWKIVSATKTIGLLNTANGLGHVIKYVEFRNQKVNEVIDVEAEFRNWPNQAVFSFCSYPYLLSLATKNSLMKLENQEVQTAMFAESVRDITTGRGVTIPFLALRVRREHLIFDTLAQLSGKTRELKKQLKVQFAGEEGVDAGGVQKEFFQLIVRQLFDPAYGMFTYSEDSRQFWFNQNSLESESEFELIGTIIGLAIYNSVILDLRFPSVVYKKLLGQKPTLKDLEDMNKELGRGLRQLLEYADNDVEDVFCLNFTISEEVYGAVNVKPLKENGDNIPVTNENRQEYVDLYVNYMLEDSIKKQFTAFQRGFYRVCGGSALKLIRPEELELFVCGDSNELDIDDLEQATAYQHYTKESPSIKNLWAVVREMSSEDKKKFLTFATGSDRVPCKGVSHLALVITRDGPDSNRLPTAHTCFNQVLLPDYSSKQKLKEKLLLSINNCEGFGLK